MKYLVMENHLSYSVVMDEMGGFYRAANLGYEIGDRVDDVVLMKDPEEESAEMKKTFRPKKRLFVSLAAAACLIMALIPALHSVNAEQASVYITINPKVRMEVEEDGDVEELEAINKDGKMLLSGYSAEDKNMNRVLDDIIARAQERGFISEGEGITANVEAEDRKWAEELGSRILSHLEEYTGGIYAITVKINGKDYAVREVIIPSTEATTAPVTEAQPTSPPATYGTGGHAGGDSGYSDHNSGGGYQAPAPASEPTRAPVSGGDSVYGDSGYYDSDSGYGAEGDAEYDD